ncbi:MAG: beta-ketoacyl-[acyl-carrier-protein] synthase family protein, partial [Candidatus Limnocylindrales bacterium]
MRSADLSGRAVITGLGAVTPIGNDHSTYWRNLVAGVSGAGPITSFDASGYDVRIAAEVKDFDPTVAMDRKMARRMSRFIHFAMAAAKEAIEDAGLHFDEWTPEQRDRVGVAINTGGGGIEAVIEGTHTLERKGPGQVSPFAIPAFSGSMAACMVSMAYRLTGPAITQVAACASSVIALIDGLRMIQRGECDVVLVGGSEAALVPMGFAALDNMGALSRRNDDPTHASRPFDRDRDGFLFGEGAGILVMERADHALGRGARIEAEVLGGALTGDAFHVSAPEPTGRGATRAMTLALREAGVAPDEVDLIVAHGTSTPLNDVTETRAIKAAFGTHARRVAITAPKSMIGHLLGAAGAMSALAAVGSIREAVIPPTINLENADLPECDLAGPSQRRNTDIDPRSVA